MAKARIAVTEALCLGGLSVAVWALLFADLSLAPVGSPGGVFSVLAIRAVHLLFIFIVFPHYLFSYVYAYSQDAAFAAKNRFALYVGPVLLVGLFALSLALWNGYGRNILAYAFVGMVCLSGWHAAMQAFGTFVVYAQKAGYALTRVQRHVVLGHLYTVWLSDVFVLNAAGSVYSRNGLSAPAWGLPLIWIQVGNAAALASLILVLAAVVAPNVRTQRRLPPAGACIALGAFYFWIIPARYVPVFAVAYPTIAHALQYLVFVNKVPSRNKYVLYAALVAVGFIFMELIPGWLDQSWATARTGVGFFTLSVFVLVNLHHYLLDSRIWKRGNGNLLSKVLAQP